jgi:hypothetical protein
MRKTLYVVLAVLALAGSAAGIVTSGHHASHLAYVCGPPTDDDQCPR